MVVGRVTDVLTIKVKSSSDLGALIAAYSDEFSPELNQLNALPDEVRETCLLICDSPPVVPFKASLDLHPALPPPPPPTDSNPKLEPGDEKNPALTIGRVGRECISSTLGLLAALGLFVIWGGIRLTDGLAAFCCISPNGLNPLKRFIDSNILGLEEEDEEELGLVLRTGKDPCTGCFISACISLGRGLHCCLSCVLAAL